MDIKAILLEAYKRGHTWSDPSLYHITEADIKKMDGTELDARKIIISRQWIDVNFRIFTGVWHQREPIYDGIVGPATEALLSLPRCPMPDFAPPPNASFHYDDPDLQRAVESMQRAAMAGSSGDALFGLAGSGSWKDCDPENKGVHSFRVRLSSANAPSTIKAYFTKALDAVKAAYAEMGCSVRYVPIGTAELTKEFINIPGGVIGYNYFPTPNSCNVITGRLDTGYAPSDYRLWANLECHETGHGVGLNHTRGSIMNPSILLVWPLTWKGTPSESSMKKYFGGNPLKPPVPKEIDYDMSPRLPN